MGLGGWVNLQSPCQWLAWAAEIRNYGDPGDSGADGRNGRDGQTGISRTIMADGTAQYLDLSGKDGSNGERGERGERAWCGSQPHNPRHDLRAADGGDGGDGGQGGDGGNGGQLTVYYTDPANLRLLTVNARGGRGGLGGDGGDGAAGCRCNRRDWTVETCSGTPGSPDYRCTEERYVCRDGRYGDDGERGADGQDGAVGRLRLVPQMEPLPADQPQVSLALQDFTDQPVALSRHLWAAKTGALNLLAPDSVMADSYEDYVGQVNGQLAIAWQAPRPLSPFANTPAIATIQPDGRIAVNVSDAVWIDGSLSQEGGNATYTITGAVAASDAARLAWGGVDGQGANLTATVIDLGRESDYVQTQFHLRLEITDDDPRDNRRPRYSTLYEDTIPAEQVNRQADRFILAVGQLPIRLRSGQYARVNLEVERSLGTHSARQTLTWQGRL